MSGGGTTSRQPIAKDDKNGAKSVKEILELVAAALQ
jgi:hypothetical protein